MATEEKQKIEAQSKAVLEFFGEDPTNKPIKALFNFFVNQELNEQKLERSIYKAMFYMFDKDGNGSLDKSEVFKLYRFLSEEREEPVIEEAIVSTLFDEIDVNGDGSLSFDEFAAFMSKTQAD